MRKKAFSTMQKQLTCQKRNVKECKKKQTNKKTL